MNGSIGYEVIFFALEHDLTMIRFSDVHSLMDWDVERDRSVHRTATLLLVSGEVNKASIKQALFDGKTAAVYSQNLIGRAQEVADIISGVLSLEVIPDPPGSRNAFRLPDTTPILLRNDGPIVLQLRVIGKHSYLNNIGIISMPAYSVLNLRIKGTQPVDFDFIEVEIVNSLISPSEHLTMKLRPQVEH